MAGERLVRNSKYARTSSQFVKARGKYGLAMPLQSTMIRRSVEICLIFKRGFSSVVRSPSDLVEALSSINLSR